MKKWYLMQTAPSILIGIMLTAMCCKEQTPATPIAASTESKQHPSITTDDSPSTCPPYNVHKGPFPHVTAEQHDAAYWLSTFSDAQLDTPLLTEAQIDLHNRAVGHSGQLPISQWTLLEPIPATQLESQLEQRLNAIYEQVTSQGLVSRTGRPLSERARQNMRRDAGVLRDGAQSGAFEVALEPIQMRCVPFSDSLFNSESDHSFDKNACSTIHPQEPLEILGQWKNKMLFVRTRYAFGFIDPNSSRSTPVPPKWRNAYMNAPMMYTDRDISVTCNSESITLPRFTILPTTEDGKILVSSVHGVCTMDAPASFHTASRPLTRRAFYQTVFSYLGTDYGFGGTDAGLDCSRFVMDVFATFHLALPRNSKHQSLAGSYAIDVSRQKDLVQKQRLLDAAQSNGIVVLYFPGHIMFYLGKNKVGIPMAIHSLGEYAKPCNSSSETVFRVKKVVVTDLEIGRGSSRHSFLERVTKIVVFGPPANPPFTVPLTYRPAAIPSGIPNECTDSVFQRIFQSPKRLIVGEPARLIATGSENIPHATLQIFERNGIRVSGQSRRLGGPPYGHWTVFTPTHPGKYTAVLGDGDTIFACNHFGVGNYHTKKKARTEPFPYWQNRWKWEQDTENLYSTFVSRLFDFPPDENISWHGLQELLNDPEHNLLFNHLGQNEDEELNLSPDCADLPYFLRAYFAWKTGLPFGVRSCSRGRKGRPPSCTEIQSNQQIAPLTEELDTEAKIFSHFANVVIGWNAHSASGRTHPKFDDTDFYPVALTREALTPGTIFADPYGHIMIISQWIPQPAGGYGVLMAIDGQPDGTIGRRRFWRGTFLFDSSTESFGAGFKRFRPVVVERESSTANSEEIVKTLENRDLRRSRIFSPYSMMQYDLSTDAFYDHMQTLINPAPLNAEELLVSRVDALQESIERRRQAISNGETYMAAKDFNIIEMPLESDIFQTDGPWEEYSTPSRDMRLLIAIDAVLETPDKVFQTPEQFGYAPTDNLTETVSHLQAVMEAELENRQFTYTRSDGSSWSITIGDIISRQKSLEIGYNPNDCVEIRWGAPPDSDEIATCSRKAPVDQMHKMEEYRSWFHTRTRPQ